MPPFPTPDQSQRRRGSFPRESGQSSRRQFSRGGRPGDGLRAREGGARRRARGIAARVLGRDRRGARRGDGGRSDRPALRDLREDGVGDVELMMRIYGRLGNRLIYIGGLPTAETFALPYQEMGVTTYSSAIFNFLPEWALSFYRAVRARDKTTVFRELNDFVFPYLEIRNRGRGYAVSIVKAGCSVIGRH